MSLYEKKRSKKRETSESVSLPAVQLKAKAESATGLSSLQSELGNAAVNAAASNDNLAVQTNAGSLQSSYGNAAMAKSISESVAVESATIPFDPRTFVFKTTVPNKNPLEEGGWQETNIVTLKFVHLGKKAFWTCSVVVGAPLRNHLGPVDPDVASIAAGLAADEANKITFEMMDCNAFKREMRKFLGYFIPGATVSSPK